MEDVTRYLNVAYITFGLVMCWLGVKFSDMIFGMFGPRADRILFGDVSTSIAIGVIAGLAITAYCWRKPKIYKWSTEVAVELSKVTWPDREDTQRSTYVVIVFSIAVSIVLAAFDFIWKFTTDAIL